MTILVIEKCGCFMYYVRMFISDPQKPGPSCNLQKEDVFQS